MWEAILSVLEIIFLVVLVIVIVMNILIEKVIVKMELNDQSVFFTIRDTSEKILVVLSLILSVNALANVYHALINL